MIIGLTGPAAGGKGTIARHLVGQGFVYFSLSDVVREQATKYGWPHTREVLQNLGDDMRAKEGADILARRISQKDEFKLANWVIIDGIRHSAEIRYFKDFFDVKIIGVTANEQKLFELMKKRDRPGDPETFEEFLKAQERESLGSGVNVMNVRQCLEMADTVVRNDGDVSDLIINTEVALLELGVRVKRASKELGL